MALAHLFVCHNIALREHAVHQRLLRLPLVVLVLPLAVGQQQGAHRALQLRPGHELTRPVLHLAYVLSHPLSQLGVELPVLRQCLPVLLLIVHQRHRHLLFGFHHIAKPSVLAHRQRLVHIAQVVAQRPTLAPVFAHLYVETVELVFHPVPYQLEAVRREHIALARLSEGQQVLAHIQLAVEPGVPLLPRLAHSCYLPAALYLDNLANLLLQPLSVGELVLVGVQPLVVGLRLGRDIVAAVVRQRPQVLALQIGKVAFYRLRLGIAHRGRGYVFGQRAILGRHCLQRVVVALYLPRRIVAAQHLPRMVHRVLQGSGNQLRRLLLPDGIAYRVVVHHVHHYLHHQAVPVVHTSRVAVLVVKLRRPAVEAPHLHRHIRALPVHLHRYRVRVCPLALSRGCQHRRVLCPYLLNPAAVYLHAQRLGSLRHLRVVQLRARGYQGLHHGVHVNAPGLVIALLAGQAVHQHLVAVQLVVVELLTQPVATRGQTVRPLHQLLVYLRRQRLKLSLHTHPQPSHLGSPPLLFQQLAYGIQYLRSVPQLRHLLGFQVVAVLAGHTAVVVVGCRVQQLRLAPLQDAPQQRLTAHLRRVAA